MSRPSFASFVVVSGAASARPAERVASLDAPVCSTSASSCFPFHFWCLVRVMVKVRVRVRGRGRRRVVG